MDFPDPKLLDNFMVWRKLLMLVDPENEEIALLMYDMMKDAKL